MNIKEYLVPDSEDGTGEEELKHILSDSSCAKKVDVENVLLKNANLTDAQSLRKMKKIGVKK